MIPAYKHYQIQKLFPYTVGANGNNLNSSLSGNFAMTINIRTTVTKDNPFILFTIINLNRQFIKRIKISKIVYRGIVTYYFIHAVKEENKMRGC